MNLALHHTRLGAAFSYRGRSGPLQRFQPSAARTSRIAIFAIAAGAGAVTSTGFAPLSFWPGTLLGVATFIWALTRTPNLKGGAATGLTYGLALASATLNWMATIDIWAAVALILLEALWYALQGLALRFAYPARFWPAFATGTWVLMEYGASRLPFGGFGWLRLGYAMLESPFAGLLPLVGVGGLSLATAGLAALAAWAAAHRSLRRTSTAFAGISAVLLAATAGSLVQLPTTGPALNVGWVQGGAPGGGIYGLGQPRTTSIRHAQQTLRLAADVADRRQPAPDLIVWPENSTDIDPSTDPTTRALITTSIQAVRAPILVGTTLDGPGAQQRRTASQLWTSDGPSRLTYIKRSLVPFGEWIPYRELLLPLLPQLRYVGAQAVPGNTPGVLSATTVHGGGLNIGVLMCFDVAFDPVVYDLPRNGAAVIVVQSSNAMYQGTSQMAQQFAITRARAAELRREIVVATTSGVSGVIDVTGKIRESSQGGAASGVTSVPIRYGVTPAAVAATPLQQLVSAGSSVWIVTLCWCRRRRHRHRADIDAARGTWQG